LTVAMREPLLVTTDDCHLCARAREVLDALAVAVREVPVDSPDAAVLAA
jgi:hypothetical protein